MLQVSPIIADVYDPPVALVKKWVAGRTFDVAFPLIDVSQAVPGYPCAHELREFLSTAVLAADTGRYAPALGLPETRAAIAHHLDRRHVGVNNVMVTAGCNQAFCLAIGALCSPGDEVILPTPFYFNHDMWLRASGIEPVCADVLEANGMLPDLDHIAAAITDRTRALVFVSPNNPCGVTYPPDLIERAYALCRAHDIALILDETYKDFRDTTDPAHELFTRRDWDETLVQLLSFSKSFSLAGYRVGSLTAAPHVLEQAIKLADCQTIGAPRISQLAVGYALNHLDDWVATQRVAMAEKLAQFRSAISNAMSNAKSSAMTNETTGGACYEIVASGAFFAYLRHPFEGVESTTVALQLADEHNVLTIPGASFGTTQSRYLRLAFGNLETAMLPELANRITASQLQGSAAPRS